MDKFHKNLSYPHQHQQMAAATPLQHSAAAPLSPAAVTCVRKLAESPELNSIPSNYVFYRDPNETIHGEVSIPTIDLSLLTSDDPDKKSKAILDLGNACRDWGFFLVVNHGIPGNLMKDMIEVVDEFFRLPEEEKPEFQPKDVLTPVRYRTSFNTAKEKVFCWRDFLKVFVHPEFHCPDKPKSLREVAMEYCERSRKVVSELVKGISKDMGLEEGEMEMALNMDSTLQILVGNYYPRCPNPEVALGMPPHSDHGLFTLLIENQVGGLQIQHNGKWVHVNAPPNSILVNTGDHLEIFSNGKYKSVLHRAVVNDQSTRISIAIANGPSPDTVVSPASKLVQKEGSVPSFVPMRYKDYLLSQQNNKLDGKAHLELIKVRDD